jgi:glyoxylate utilization-related uncharacterized protein
MENKMSDSIAWSRQEDVERIWLKEGIEFTHRLITKDTQGASFSFHITTFKPDFEHTAIGDGVHESVLFCLQGGSTQTLPDGHVHEFRPGDAMYLPKEFTYEHKVGSGGLVMAVACNPSR